MLYSILKNPRSFLLRLWGDFGVRVFLCLGLSMAFLIILFNFITIRSQQKLLTLSMVKEGENLTNLLADTVRLGVFSENTELLVAPVQAILKQHGVLNVKVLNKNGNTLFEDQRNDIARDGRCDSTLETDWQTFEEELRQSHSAIQIGNTECLVFGAPVMVTSSQSAEHLYFAAGQNELQKKEPAGFVVVAFNQQILEKSRRRVISESIVIAILFLLLAAMTTYLIVKSATRPLSRLVKTIKKDSDLNTGTHDDLGLLSESFSSMVDQLAESFVVNTRLQNELEDLARELIKAQEKERQKLALELHDNVAQELSSLKISCNKLLHEWPESPESIVDSRNRIPSSIQKCIRIVRELSQGLQPSELSQLGLVSTISHLCDDFAMVNAIEVDFLSTGFEDFEPDYNSSINCYRIIQEALNNILKHAKASHIEIRLVASFPQIILRIKDDGVGFAVESRVAQAVTKHRMGLKNMEKRASLLNGLMVIKSHIGKGTRILVELPYTQRNNDDA